MLIHKHHARLSPRLIPGSSPRSGLHTTWQRIGGRMGEAIGSTRLSHLESKRSRDLDLQPSPKARYNGQMDKHSRASGRPGKGKRRHLSTLEKKQQSGKEAIPDQLVELATDAIRDGRTTVATFLAPFHPDLRFTAFRAYTAAMLAFMAKWRR